MVIGPAKIPDLRGLLSLLASFPPSCWQSQGSSPLWPSLGLFTCSFSYLEYATPNLFPVILGWLCLLKQSSYSPLYLGISRPILSTEFKYATSSSCFLAFIALFYCSHPCLKSKHCDSRVFVMFVPIALSPVIFRRVNPQWIFVIWLLRRFLLTLSAVISIRFICMVWWIECWQHHLRTPPLIHHANETHICYLFRQKSFNNV